MGRHRSRHGLALARRPRVRSAFLLVGAALACLALAALLWQRARAAREPRGPEDSSVFAALSEDRASAHASSGDDDEVSAADASSARGPASDGEDGASGGETDEPGHAASDPAVSRRHSSLSLREEARSVLSGYRDRGSCVLARSGFIDAWGGVWSCTVVGGSWVEVQVLREAADGGTEAVLVRMDGDAWAEEWPFEVLSSEQGEGGGS